VPSLLDRLVARHPVIISRGVMLDRAGIQAFSATIVDGPALRLSPLAMRRLGVSPDGRELTVFVPVSEQARREVGARMMARGALRSPVDGSLLLPLSPEALAGLYRLTQPDDRGATPRHFATPEEVSEAFARGELRPGSAVRVGRGSGRYLSTAGRCLVAAELSTHLPSEEPPRPLDRPALAALLDQVAASAGDEAAARAAQSLERLGSAHATRSGSSLGLDDLVAPPARPEILAEAHARCAAVQEMYDEGLITDGERYQKVVDLWSEASDRMAWSIQEQFQGPAARGALAALCRSGAIDHGYHVARKLGGMVGLTARPWGEVIERPILGSLRSGLGAHEQFMLTMVGRAAATLAQLAGQKQRTWLGQLADLLRHVAVVEEDCRSPVGLWVREIGGGHDTSTSLRGRLAGRLLAREVAAFGPDRRPLAESDTSPTPDQLDAIEREGPRAAEVRSPVGCEARGGLCAACAGAPVGEPVGMQAAQALVAAAARLPWSEPIFLVHSSCRHVQPNLLGVESLAPGRLLLCRGELARLPPEGALVVVSPDAEIAIEQADLGIVQRTVLKHASSVLVEPGESVLRGQQLSRSDPFETRLLSDRAARVSRLDVVEGISQFSQVDEVTGLCRKIILEPAGAGLSRGPVDRAAENARQLTERVGIPLQPRMVLTSADGAERVIPLTAGAFLRVEAGDVVARGQLLLTLLNQVNWPRERASADDLASLLDWRPTRDDAVIAEIAGMVSIEGYGTSRTVVVTPDSPDEGSPWRHPVGWRYLVAQAGMRVQAGDLLVDGPIDLAALLRVVGRPEAAAYLVDLLLETLQRGGPTPWPRLIEVVVGAMLRRVRVVAAGEGPWERGARVDRGEFTRQAARLAAEGRRPPEAAAVVEGLATRARALRRGLRR
jgi:DNA-directed RNA polymerase subunit beta'